MDWFINLLKDWMPWSILAMIVFAISVLWWLLKPKKQPKIIKVIRGSHKNADKTILYDDHLRDDHTGFRRYVAESELARMAGDEQLIWYWDGDKEVVEML